ncbi:pre-mRNA-processing factor 31 [Gaeumannomyces tritici R3-111a-1]|uniref:Pre-mRNA-processing factor 31 n=1 Tax=Gaeumannomyces tritici (strain R3-111a-1) TaxID=644352 RepID=J3NJ85_GAET3|nr:pre-mRNA-processing factor 31 [Gaeumannomyces tritici R3-111a-1]EJT81336.1 pre-mRNA-processing factor 31 [Gaeumannomyces tritici R3-111a-1]
MSTLVDELLQDFEDSASENGGDRSERGDDDGLGDEEGAALMGGGDGMMEIDANDMASSDEDEEMGGVERTDDPEEMKAKVDKMQLRGVDDIRTVATLMKTLEPVLEKITFYQSQPAESQTANLGNVEDHPEYHLLTQSNSLSTQIDSEIVLVHKYIKDHYSVRFPELETLITSPLEYAKVVAVLGNGPLDADGIKALQLATDNPLGVSLKSVLDGPSLMIVTIGATTSKGREMTPEALAKVVRACHMVISLDKAKRALTEYVQSRMNIFAPNLTALIGSLTAAQLLNTAGGLTGLAKTPACNIAAWGSKKGAGASGFATNVGVRQRGYLYNSPIIKSVPQDLKKQGLRIVSAKLILAARIDCSHEAPDGSQGDQLREACETRIEKLQEKPLNKGARALPAPDDKPSRKRGGRRARMAKAATAMTDLRKAQNRMAFGKEEKEVGYGTGDSTAGLGMIGQAAEGRVRGMQVDNRTRAKLTAKNKGWGGIASSAAGPTTGAASSLKGFGQSGGLDLRGRGLRASGVGTTLGSGGTMSSLAFTPLQGLELVDPKMQAELGRKRKAEEDRWFKGGTFTQISGGGGGGPADDGVFKKPALPAAKRLDTGATKSGR